MNDMIIDAEPEAGTALANLAATNLATIITTPGAMDALLDRIERDARAIRAGLDISTEKGRKAIGSLAKSKVANAKVQIVEAANKLTEGWRRDTAAVVADRKRVEARLDALRDEIEAEVVAYRAAKAATEKANEDAIAALEALLVGLSGLTSAEIEDRIKQAGVVLEFGWAPEFVQRAERAFGGVAAQLHMAHQAAVTREAEVAAEIERQAKEVERQRLAAIEAQRVREAEIAAEATRQAEIAAERKAQRADYHRRMLQHVKGCGLGFIDEQQQPLGILQHELTNKIKYDEENFGDLLPEAVAARDEALKRIQRSIDESIRRAQEEEAREAAALREREDAQRAKEAAQARIQAEAERARQAEVVAERLRQQAEIARIEAHRAALVTMQRLAAPLAHPDPVPVIDAKIGQLADVFSRDWDEFEIEAVGVHATCAETLQRHRAESVEIAAARDAKAELERKEAQRVRDEAAQTMAAANLAQAQQQAAAALKLALETERQAVAAEREAIARQAADREKNLAHKKQVNGDVVADIMKAMADVFPGNADEAKIVAVDIMKALARKEVRRVRIEY